MISIYLHIPFCQSKCNYCSFTSFPIWEQSENVQKYINELRNEIKCYSELLWKQQIKTLYFWWGTPNLLGAETIISLIEDIGNYFDLTDLWELSFEFNPYPEKEIYDIIKQVQSRFWKEYPRIRFSFWIQSFDNEVLQLAWRKTLFLWLVDFLRWLQPLKQDNTVFNFDFIAFWKWNKSKKWNRYLWNPAALDFFKDFVNSLFADSFSLYTLELLWDQVRKTKSQERLISWSYFWTDEEIDEEFCYLKDIIQEAWYWRYEISNFSLAGKSSIHNRAYWEMWDYLGLGLNSSSFFNQKTISSSLKDYFWLVDIWCWVRFKNTTDINAYIKWEKLDRDAFQVLTYKDYLIESFFLALRTDIWINHLSDYNEILTDDYALKLKLFANEGLVFLENDELVLTDIWMDVYNYIVTEIMKEI